MLNGIYVLRPDDLLVLYLELRNLALDPSDPSTPRLVVQQHAKPAFIIAHFPPQSIIEQAFFEPGDAFTAAGTIGARIAGLSRLVFKLPAAMTEIPYQLASLLDWTQFELVVSATADGHATPLPLQAPGGSETAIELPYRLVLSPGSGAGWINAQLPATHAGRTELWHTRLGKAGIVHTANGSQQAIQEASESNKMPLRAVWSPDFVDHGPLPLNSLESPFRAAMNPNDRAQIVILSSGTTGYFVEDAAGRVTPYTPLPIEATRLYLSALGGWLTSRGSWPVLPAYSYGGLRREVRTVQLDLSEWSHVATQGRDHYVRIVYEGYLYPFGHRAALIKVTERKVVSPDGGTIATPTAYMVQHEYIVVREREKSYDTSLYTFAGREMPFYQNVTIKTAVTPEIDAPSYITADGNSFWIEVGGSGFPFHVTAVDLAGATIDFLAQLIFIDESENDPTSVATQYAASPQRACLVAGQKIAYADPSAGDTIMKTTQLVFTTQPLGISPPLTTFPFAPILDTAEISVQALEQLLGTTSPVTIALYSAYLASGLDSNAGVFASIETALPVAFSANKAGGFATPNLSVTALSARKGAVAGKADDAAAGNIDPADYFGDVSAKLFGTIPLQNLIPVGSDGKADAATNAPEIRTQFLPNSKSPLSSVTKITWSPQLQSYTEGPVNVQFGGGAELTLHAQITRNLSGGAPSSDANGKLSNFTISLFNVIELSVAEITFTSQNGAKSNVVAKLASSNPITLTGPLAFVQQLAQILPPGIFGGSGPSIDLQPTQLRVSYTLGLPPVSVGVFSLENIAITVALDLPYVDGKPAFEFAFASRSKPFLLTIECFGGGGFIHLIVNADGVQMVEGALEFGGQLAFDIGVASGGVHVMAGIYFQLKGSDSTLTGFVDIGGEVSVLGIISISIDLNLSLSYIVQGSKKTIQGRATLTVSIHILFFSASVKLSVEKSFSSGSGDPSVRDVLTAQDWAAYATAFA